MRALLAGLVVVFVAGCTDTDPVAGSFPDATFRFVAHDEDMDEAFEVPEGNVTLLVATHYVLDRGAALIAQLIIEGPGAHLAALDQAGPVEEKDPRWVTLRNATAGTWRIKADLEGSGDYLFAVSFEAAPA